MEKLLQELLELLFFQRIVCTNDSFFHTFSRNHYNIVILIEKTKSFLHFYTLEHFCFTFFTVFISLYLSSLTKFCMLDLKCNYNQFYKILGQFSLNIGIYSPSSFSHLFFFGFVKALFMTLN